ncbi:MAG: hypothetical protein AB8B86_14325 [Pseudomonadales bacterium]
MSNNRIITALPIVWQSPKKLGNIDEARKLFLEVALTSSDDQHAGAAKQQYRELTRQSTNVGKGSAASNWQAMVDIRLGGDDNVIDPSDLSGSNTSDSFVETLLTSRWSSDHSSGNRCVADSFVYASRYDEVSEYDIDMVDIGFKKYFKEEFGSWHIGGAR